MKIIYSDLQDDLLKEESKHDFKSDLRHI